MKPASSTRTIAFLGNYLPRKCGIATFTSDLLGAAAARHAQCTCFAVAVNDIDGHYRSPDAHALIVSGRATRKQDVYDRGIKALRWLVGVQTAQSGHLRPIGSNGFYQRGGARADFDQQPLEAHATVSACLEAFRVSADPWWYERAQRAFDWFLGWNDLGLEVYARESGGCRDGLHADRANENQGAESTLAFLLSLAEMRLMQNTAIGVPRPGLPATIAQ